MNTKENFFRENISEIKLLLENNIPLMEVARTFNLKYETLKKYLVKYSINYNTNQMRKGFVNKIDKDDLTPYLNNEKYISASSLRDKLIRCGLKVRQCECCKNTEWLGQPIPLELHHKNEDHYDNSLENLEILCSNCHSTKHGYGQAIKQTVEDVVKKVRACKKQKKDKKTSFCSICGKEIQANTKTGKCQTCLHIEQRKIEWPNKEILIKLHSEYSNVRIGKMYGVSDKTIKNWLKYYNIE